MNDAPHPRHIVLSAVENCTGLIFYGASEGDLKSVCRTLLHNNTRYFAATLYDDSGRQIAYMRKTDFDWRCERHHATGKSAVAAEIIDHHSHG